MGGVDGWYLRMQGEMINEAGTLTGGGGKPRGGRMCLGTAAPRAIDSREAASELASAEQQLEQQMQVSPCTKNPIRPIVTAQSCCSKVCQCAGE